MFLLFILAIVHILETKEGYVTSQNIPTSSPSANTKYKPNQDIQYHAPVEDILKQLDTDMDSNLLNTVDSSGKLVQVPLSQTTSDTTYYTSGSLKYNPENYVPNYEDTVYFSKLTGLGYQTPVVNYDYQFSGFCKYDRYFPEKIEEKCNKLDVDSCASTSCCVLLGSKCVAGNTDGPLLKAHYSDIDIKNKDKYFYMGRCYGNCVDEQSNFFKYSNDSGITNQSYIQSFPSFTATNPAYLPKTSDYLDATVPKRSNTSRHHTPNWLKEKCHIDYHGNLLDLNDNIIATNVKIDAHGNFVDSQNNKIMCPIYHMGSPSPAGSPSHSGSPSPAASCHVTKSGKLIDPNGSIVAYNVVGDIEGSFYDTDGNQIECPIPV